MSSGLVKQIRKYSETEILSAMNVLGYRMKRYPGRTFNEDLGHVPKDVLIKLQKEIPAQIEKVRKTKALLLNESEFFEFDNRFKGVDFAKWIAEVQSEMTTHITGIYDGGRIVTYGSPTGRITK